MMAGPKLIAQLREDSREQLGEITEAGMGYYVVKGMLDNEDRESVCIISGDFYIIPIEHARYFSLTDLGKYQPFPLENQKLASVKLNILSFVSINMLSGLKLPTVKLPFGYTYAFGAIPLLGTITLKYVTNFYRYTGSQSDPCFNGTELSAGTYLTPAKDIGYANTGFAAVGRYALPIPAPASYQHLYQLPIGTTLGIGTVIPNYGQAGGGVEVQLAGKKQVTWFGSIKIDDY
jgi:hypothetical protein